MNKKVIIGSLMILILALVPVVGVFAADTDTTKIDTINITVSSSCTFARQAYSSGGVTNNTSHKNGTDGTWSTTANDHTLSATRSNGTVTTALGTSQFKIVCNNSAGYKVTLTTTSLSTSGASPLTIPSNTNYSASVSGWSPLVGTTKQASGATVKTESTTTAGSTFEIGYGVGISTSQAAGTYTGTATYTLATL